MACGNFEKPRSFCVISVLVLKNCGVDPVLKYLFLHSGELPTADQSTYSPEDEKKQESRHDQPRPVKQKRSQSKTNQQNKSNKRHPRITASRKLKFSAVSLVTHGGFLPNAHSRRIYVGDCFVPGFIWHKTSAGINVALAVFVRLIQRTYNLAMLVAARILMLLLLP